MQFIAIILLAILAAIVYGICHDQVTARVCVEYFTVAHPPVFQTESPTLLGLGWGTIATWWMGLVLGIPLALASRAGKRRVIDARDLVRPIAGLLLIMGLAALVFGTSGYLLARSGVVKFPTDWESVISSDQHTRFMFDVWAHMASYLVGFFGGLVLIVKTWCKRRLIA